MRKGKTGQSGKGNAEGWLLTTENKSSGGRSNNSSSVSKGSSSNSGPKGEKNNILAL